ncbi:MAG TPA: hypothetical protein PKH33_03720 [bacterium]|nr:hypothetical protein [bacterium]
MSDKKIYLVCGFHVNCNHSWRGDRNDKTGFGTDLKIIREIIRILDEANERGLDARGTWDFDHYWSLENIIPRFAPDIIEGLVRRIKQGKDEAILGCWNNGDLAASTVEEFRESLKRTISNSAGSGLADLFGAYSPVVRTQETMFTHGGVELYLEQGVKAIALYYSAVPFDSVRNFIPRLTPNEMHNPLRFHSTESDAAMLMIPMYNQGDIMTAGSLRKWAAAIRKKQKSGEIPGNALLYINMDADAELWTGIGLPKIFDRLPNTRGLAEFIDTVNDTEYLEFGKLGDYIENNPPVGDITVRQDLADGSYCGFNSWTEKLVNQGLWRLSEKARKLERTADFLSAAAAPDARAEIERLLRGPGGSCFENKLLLLSTTHFGMNSPVVHPDRARVAFHLARNMLETSSRAAELAAAQSGVEPLCGEDGAELFCFSVVNQTKYGDQAAVERGARVLMRVPFMPVRPADPARLALKDSSGADVPFDIDDAKTDADGNVVSAVLWFAHTADGSLSQGYALVETSEPVAPAESVKASSELLDNGLVSVRLDPRGRIASFASSAGEFSDGQLISLGATYRAESNRKHYTPRAYKAESARVGPAGRLGSISLSSKTVIFCKGKNYTVEGRHVLRVFDGFPRLFVDADASFPQTPTESEDISSSSHTGKKFDTRWYEVMPAEIRPALFSPPGGFLRVWKHNYKNVTNSYDFDYGAIDKANRAPDACNNQVTDGWLAVSDTKRGLLISADAGVNSSPAYCPMRVRESGGRQRASLNPFGTYFGKQFSHLNEGFNLAYEMTMAVGAQHRPTAPSFNGGRVRMSLMLAPYEGDAPSQALRTEADLFSMPPAVIVRDSQGKPSIPDSDIEADLAPCRAEHDLDACAGWKYSDFLEYANKDFNPGAKAEKGASIATFVRMIVEGIRIRS